MSYPENIPSINDMLNLPAGELAQLPVELLAALQAELDHAAKQLKAASAKFSTALEVRYATRAAASNATGSWFAMAMSKAVPSMCLERGAPPTALLCAGRPASAPI